jgi:hypothetical protein
MMSKPGVENFKFMPINLLEGLIHEGDECPTLEFPLSLHNDHCLICPSIFYVKSIRKSSFRTQPHR